jgi:hypothetical protein
MLTGDLASVSKTFEQVIVLLGKAKEQLRMAQSDLARAQASVLLLEQLAADFERVARKEGWLR